MRALKISMMWLIFVVAVLFAVFGVKSFADGANSSSVASISASNVVPGEAVATDEGDEKSVVQKILDAAPDWLQILSLIITAGASIAAVTPSPKDDGALAVLRKIIDFIGLNFLGAKNASAVKNPNDLR